MLGLLLALVAGYPLAAWGTAAATPQLVDIHPDAAMLTACSNGTIAACNRAALADIDYARRTEGLGPLGLPRDYSALSAVSQVVAVTNAERRSRGLPALSGPRQAFDAMAQQGASRWQDPSGPSGATWASNLATGIRTVLEADFDWMYNDGPGGNNADCMANDFSGCWAHRDNILSPWPGMMGAAALPEPRSGDKVLSELLVKAPAAAHGGR